MESKTRRNILAMAAKNNLKVLDMKTGTHIKVLVQRPDGSTSIVIEAISPSCNRGNKNAQAMWRQAGLGIGKFAPKARK